MEINFILLSTIIITIAILLLVCILGRMKEGFRADPADVMKTKNILKNPNTYKEFKSMSCANNATRNCVDAVDYMDSRKMVSNGTFTRQNIEKMLQ